MAGTIKITPDEFADKHARRLKGAIEDIRTGVMKVTESPTAKAAAKEQKMLQNLQSAVQSGKWSNRLKAVTLDQWQSQVINKGLGRVASGVDEARDKVTKFASQLLPYESDLKSKIDKMPDLTIEDSVSRATAWIRGMSKFERK